MKQTAMVIYNKVFIEFHNRRSNMWNLKISL